MCSAAPADVKGRIFEIQRFSIDDGPGIRTAVFLKGCPLKCAWCHNPEGVDSRALLSFDPKKCIGCGYCLRVCTRHAHLAASDGAHGLDRGACVVCADCTKECWAGALELVGRDASVADVMAEARRDVSFYETSGGGITLSGGEPTAQLEFTDALLRAARAEGFHCCLETCGFAPPAAFERVMPHVQLFLFDIKETDEARHLEFTGVPNVPILANLKMLHDRGATIRLRLPLIPGYNDREEHLDGIASLVRALPRLEGVEIMPYHALALAKYQRLGLRQTAALPSASLDDETLHRWIEALQTLGVVVINA